jgi:hypothetical protein
VVRGGAPSPDGEYQETVGSESTVDADSPK